MLTDNQKNQMASIHQNREAIWLHEPALQQIFNALLIEGDEVKIVGGAPRNHLLGEKVADIDLATILTPEEVIEKAKAANIKSIPTGIEHGTVTLIVDNKPYEITTLREDVETDGRHAKVKFGKSWLQDARRRDFTINAIYVRADGTIETPIETSLQDIKNRKIRFIGEAETRIKEDHLRSLRFYRFLACYGTPPYDQSAIDATIKRSHQLAGLSAERVTAELFKILTAPNAGPVLELLYSSGILVRLLNCVPDIGALLRYIKIEKNLNHPPDAALRFAMLTIWHHGDVKRLAKKWKLSKKDQRQLEMKPLSSQLPKPDEYQSHIKGLYHYGKSEYISLLKAAFAQSPASVDDSVWLSFIKNIEKENLPAFPLKGEDLIEKGIKPGPEMGRVKSTLEDIWLNSNMKLSAKELLEHPIWKSF